jgi:Acetyltransferase (GNAT) domain
VDLSIQLTHDLSQSDKSEIRLLFESVFEKSFPPDVFDRKYAQSCLGYSWHALLRREGRIVGAYSAIPIRYRFYGNDVMFAIGVDLMVAKHSRGHLRSIKEMIEGLHSSLAAAGVAFIFGCAREEMRPFHEKVSNWRLIAKVPYHIAPLRASQLGFAAGPVKVLLRGWNRIRQTAELIHPIGSPNIEKICDTGFLQYRYNIFPAHYRVVRGTMDTKGWYLTDPYYPIEGVPDGVRFGILMDVTPFSRRAFDEAIGLIAAREPELDYLAYQGFLPFQPVNIIRVPERFERKAWYALGRVLRPDFVDDRIFDIRCWNLNLSNGDLV